MMQYHGHSGALNMFVNIIREYGNWCQLLNLPVSGSYSDLLWTAAVLLVWFCSSEFLSADVLYSERDSLPTRNNIKTTGYQNELTILNNRVSE